LLFSAYAEVYPHSSFDSRNNLYLIIGYQKVDDVSAARVVELLGIQYSVFGSSLEIIFLVVVDSHKWNMPMFCSLFIPMSRSGYHVFPWVWKLL